MARIQILELPEGSSDDRPPFVLVVDEISYPTAETFQAATVWWRQLASGIGAQDCIVTDDTMEIPANDVPVDENGQPLFLKVHVEGEFEQFREQVQQEIQYALGKVTRALRESDPVRERADIARDMDRLAKWKQELANALGMDGDGGWDALLTATAAMRAELIRAENAREQLRNDRDEARNWARHGYEIGQKHCSWSDHGVAPDWLTQGWPPHIDSCEHLQQAAEYDTALTHVRNLPEQPEIMDAQHPDPSGYLHGYAVAIREAKRASYPPQVAEAGGSAQLCYTDDGGNHCTCDGGCETEAGPQ